MIKRKIKKKIRKRKNPISSNDINEYILYLAIAITTGKPEDLTDAINFDKQGFWCEDCNSPYSFCQCEYCDDCNSNRCLCKYNIHSTYWDDHLKQFIKFDDKEKVRNTAWKIARQTLSETDMVKLKYKVKELQNKF